MFKFLLKTLDFLANAFASGHAMWWIYLGCVVLLSVQANFFGAVIFAIPVAFILSLVIGLPVVLLDELAKWLNTSAPHATPPANSSPPHRRLP